MERSSVSGRCWTSPGLLGLVPSLVVKHPHHWALIIAHLPRLLAVCWRKRLCPSHQDTVARPGTILGRLSCLKRQTQVIWQLTISLIQADAYWNCQVLSNHFHHSHSRGEDSHRNRQSNPLSNQTTEFRWPFSRERERATGMMKHVLLVYTEGDVIPLLCLPTISPWQIVFQALWVFQLSVYHHNSLWLTVIDMSSEKLIQC